MEPQEPSREPEPLPEEYRATFEELQRLEQGKMQSLGDELLPGVFVQLVGLKRRGLNTEGKTTRGVPDSFVGKTPEAAHAAVEYTTQATQLDKKFLSDFDNVRKECPNAQSIFLCTNRDTEGLDLHALRLKADQARVHLEVIDGRKLAEWLCTLRQDLRRRYLGIPIGAHTGASLIHTLREHLRVMTERRTEPGALEQFVPRGAFDLAVIRHTRRGPGWTLLTAPAGMGKTTWSVEHAHRYSFVEPMVWMRAMDLAALSTDPVGERIALAAYGASDAGRLPELAELLRREKRLLLLFIDALDEARDYGQSERQLRSFRGSALARHAHVILLCREQAAPLLVEALTGALPELGDAETRLVLPGLGHFDSELLLRRQGASEGQIRQVQTLLPSRYVGNPLFLEHALRLHRSGELASAGEDLIPAVAAHYEKDIQRRLSKDGKSPALKTIRAFLGGMALQALRQGRDTLGPDEIEALSPEEGENTMLSRAEQTGLLVRRDEGRIGFSHPLFLEHFAAVSIGGGDLTLHRELLVLGGGSGREALLRVIGAVADPTPLLRLMLETDPLGACEAATRLRSISDAELSERLLSVVKTFLESRFPSDVRHALRLLGKLPFSWVQELAVTWFNGLPAEGKQRWLTEAAELFLSLRLEGAVQVILHHRALLHSPGHPWYEPAFVQRLRALPEPLRAALLHRARQELQAQEDEVPRARLLNVLASLGELWLVEHLRAQRSRRLLTADEHRALIHLNTEEALQVYAESAEQYLCLLDERELPASESAEQQDYSRALWHRIVLKSADIVMYPHEQLVELVAGALESENWRNVAFGLDWAETLASPKLIHAYSMAQRRFPQMLLSVSGLMMVKVLEVLPFEQIRELYERTASSDVRREIVQLLRSTDPKAESFLVERLSEPEYQFSAIQSLGLVGATRAGAAIQRFLSHESPAVRSLTVTSLGRLRYLPALEALIGMFDEPLRLRSEGDAQKVEDLEYALIESIGSMGGLLAYEALRRGFRSTQARAYVLEVLVKAAVPDALQLAVELVEAYPEHKVTLAKGISDAFLSRRVGARTRAKPETGVGGLPIMNERALGVVLDVARAAVASGKLSRRGAPLTAVAAFGLPEAQAFLEELAAREPGPEPDPTGVFDIFVEPVRHARELLGMLGHPLYLRAEVERVLARMKESRFLSGLDIEELSWFPRDMVAGALRQKLLAREETYRTLFLFRWFAEPEDRELFAKLEGEADLRVADLAHEFLSNPRKFKE